jgi:hypothetical protein
MSAVAVSWKNWLLAAAAGLVVALLMVALFKVPTIDGSFGPAEELVTPAKVELAWHGNELLIEEVALRDPTPLFLPTEWNASEDALAMNAPREPGGSFQDYAPHFVFPESELQLKFGETAEVPKKAAEVFAISGASQSLLGLGQIDRELPTLPVRGAFIEVVAANDGEVIMSQPLMDCNPPEQGSWQPLDFLVAIDAAGIVRPPVLTESSRVTNVDSFFEEYLVKVLRIGERLAPGFYRVSIGP